MWNLYTNLEQSIETWKELLNVEFEYALRMARIESRPLQSSLANYTEWYDMAHATGDRIEWAKCLLDAQSRNAVFQNEVIPEIIRQFPLCRKEIEESHAGFACETCKEYFSESPELLLTLHFRNKFAPDSPFDHIRELACGLQALVSEFREEHPEISRVQCASWLNNRPEFLQFFPREWTDNRTLCLPMEGSQGWWGAFVNRKGEFNSKFADRFRRNGGFIMPNLHCRCTVNSLKKHIDQFVSSTY